MIPGLPTQGSSGHSQQLDVDETTQEQVNAQPTQGRAEIEKRKGWVIPPKNGDGETSVGKRIRGDNVGVEELVPWMHINQ